MDIVCDIETDWDEALHAMTLASRHVSDHNQEDYVDALGFSDEEDIRVAMREVCYPTRRQKKSK